MPSFQKFFSEMDGALTEKARWQIFVAHGGICPVDEEKNIVHYALPAGRRG